MKTAKGFVNPTEYFFHQSMNPPTEYRGQISEFVNKLIDLRNCVLCKQKYDITTHIPRILIHCGHTFCTSCLLEFYRNMRVRCPLCLKLIKNIETIERLPINHTIFSRLVEEYNATRKSGEKELDLKTILYTHFAQSQEKQSEEQEQSEEEDEEENGEKDETNNVLKNNFMNENNNPPKPNEKKINMNDAIIKNDDNNEEFSYCSYHPDRVRHFYCLKDKTISCRVCTEYLHSKDGCAVVDLYEVEDIGEFLSQAKSFEGKGEKKEKKEQEGEDEDFVDDGNLYFFS